MKHRLSDHDELVVRDLASDWTGEGYRTAPHQGKLNFVWLAEGRAWGVTPYRLASVPVETDVEGAIATHEGIAGGTVNITKADPPSGRSLWNLCKPATCLPSAYRRGLLEPQVRRQARRPISPQGPRGNLTGLAYVLPESYDHCARIVWSDDTSVCPDHPRPYSNGVQGTVEGRWLARAFCLVLDHSEAETVTLTLNDSHAFVVSPSGWTPDDPFALVMTVRTKTADWSPPRPPYPP